MKSKWLVLLLALLMACSIFAAERYERKETFYAGGGLWGPPSNWNPLNPWAAVTGTIGLIYEPLFLYDPVTDALTPWIAEAGEWVTDHNYRVVIRKGITWQDGKPLTAEDVKFTFEFPGKFGNIHYYELYRQIKEIQKVDDYTLVFVFENPRYHEWIYQLYQIPILPKHLWDTKPETEVLAGSNEFGAIGSGAYTFETYDLDRMVYLKNDNWWATKLLGIEVAPKRVVYIRALSNNVVLGMIMKGEEFDISNFFLPGIPAIRTAYGIHTWFESAPYMLSDNTAFLFVNNTKAPLNNPALRRAMAFAIDSKEIARRVFENAVLPSNPLGFLPADGWMKYYNEDVVAKYGFGFDPNQAKKILDDAGFKDVNGDKFREAPDGKVFKMDIIVPFGWTDWMESIKIIAKNLNDIGLRAEATFPDYNKYFDQISSGDYDLAINNFNSFVSSTPWTLYNWLYAPIISGRANSGNFQRANDTEMEDWIDLFNGTPFNNVADGKAIMAKMQEKFLKEMPAIPLWYNGMWYAANTAVWDNWPGENTTNKAYPCTWGGRWQIGGLMMLTKIKAK